MSRLVACVYSLSCPVPPLFLLPCGLSLSRCLFPLFSIIPLWFIYLYIRVPVRQDVLFLCMNVSEFLLLLFARQRYILYWLDHWMRGTGHDG